MQLSTALSVLFMVGALAGPTKHHKKKCGAGAAWDTCASPCPAFCNPPPGSGEVCIALCVEGCKCKQKDYVFNDDGSCIAPEKCVRRPVHHLKAATGA
ncbi:hypothetical protein BGZ63DRAFT_381721 [Mariannaea sp. PMI_226]|nr:hypothetical protein BGZ63DRAFT_381721 [Mariannaea sp. PMI_226]